MPVFVIQMSDLVTKKVWPLSGPIQGETNVTIEGTNLGSKFEDIVHSIFVANTKCAPYRSLYSASRRIVCRTGWKGSVHSGPVEIRLTGEPVIQSSETFSYKSPTIFSIHPQNGPISGGSRVTIFGHDLDTGAQLRAVLGDSPCIIDRGTLTPDSVVCLTTHVLWPAVKRPVRLAFDGTFVTIDQQFHYREDPVIISIQPLSSIQQGGRLLTVKGSNLGFIQNPKMFAYVPMDDGRFYTTDNTMCTSVDVEEIRCPSPSLDWNHLPLPTIIHSRRRRTSSHFQIGFPQNNSNQNGGHFRVSGGQNFGTYRWRKRSNAFQPLSTSQLAFIMDGVLSLRNMTMMEGIDSKLVYYPNPFIFNFSDLDSIKVFKGEMLIIEGEGLTLAAHVADVKVWVGGEMCNVSLLSPSQIVCDPPISQPFGLGVDGRLDSSVLPLVVVFVNSKRYEVGWLKYNIPEVFHFPVEATAGIAAGGGILLVLILLILLVYRRQRCRSERIYRKLQIQLDNLESNVRNECKQAFAELQTDMTDLTSDLTSSGIPFWDYHTYTFKVLFPHLSSHAILHPLLQKNGNLRLSEHGLQLFHQLLNKKIFLLAFIRMLDNQRTFSMRDKARVASLLIIVYQNNMEYITDILKVLLKDLIRKSVLDRHPKLMFRRSESVVEKLLTNWLSLCLYTHLKDHAGASLFMLYKAIKLQVEKGPVDVVTGDARYSLSEDRLLREKIEPKILMLNVEHGVEMVQCRVLDCDTVTQVKEKILEHLFKNVPFSQRPCMDDLELEWRNGPTGPLTLCDEDIASHNSSGWRRLNTLGYYNVRNDAYMSLLYRQHTYKTLNGTFDHTLLMSMAGNNYPTKSARGDEGKVWHLVKHDDTHMKDGGYKMISEIFLTRLLSTKGILQKYIDDLFTIVLSVNNVPPTVKFIFDFLDSEALHHGVTDPEVVHTWKCNTLPLRFWVNMIKNPDFVLDINKSLTVDSCLSVVGQTFMDSCSTSEHRLGKDSPSNKLLFAKDIVQYRKLVEKYLTVIRLLPPITDHEMSLHLSGVSRMCSGKFYISSALRDLYSYLSTFRNEMLYTLEQDSQATAHQMSVKLGHVIATMEGPSSPMAYV